MDRGQCLQPLKLIVGGNIVVNIDLQNKCSLLSAARGKENGYNKGSLIMCTLKMIPILQKIALQSVTITQALTFSLNH